MITKKRKGIWISIEINAEYAENRNRFAHMLVFDFDGIVVNNFYIDAIVDDKYVSVLCVKQNHSGTAKIYYKDIIQRLRSIGDFYNEEKDRDHDY